MTSRLPKLPQQIATAASGRAHLGLEGSQRQLLQPRAHAAEAVERELVQHRQRPQHVAQRGARQLPCILQQMLPQHRHQLRLVMPLHIVVSSLNISDHSSVFDQYLPPLHKQTLILTHLRSLICIQPPSLVTRGVHSGGSNWSKRPGCLPKQGQRSLVPTATAGHLCPACQCLNYLSCGSDMGWCKRLRRLGREWICKCAPRRQGHGAGPSAAVA